MPPNISSPSAPAPAADSPAGDLQSRYAFWFFAIQTVAGTFLQKIGNAVPISLPLLTASIAVLAAMGVIRINSTRLILYSLFVFLAVTSQFFSTSTISIASLSLFIILYAHMVIEIDVDSETFGRCMRFFVSVMLIFSAIVFIQQILQFTVGPEYWPDLNKIPSYMLYPGYQYWRETGYNSGIFMPNGVFFLEPSIIGQFLVLSLVIELIYFKRAPVILALASGAGLTMSGTAAIVLLFAAPLILLRSPPRVIASLMIGAAILLALGIYLGLAETLLARTAEFSQPGTSGYARFTLPFMKLVAQHLHYSTIYTGIGAGNASGQYYDFHPPFTKLIIEYGDLAAVAFYAFFLTSIFGGGRSVRLGMALFAFHTFGGGGLIVPVYVITIILLGTILTPPRPEPTGRPAFASRPRSG